MKIRKGFVSNSSSSSFICDITGEAFEVSDGEFCYSGYGQCEYGHVFPRDMFGETKDWISDNNAEDVPAEFCPVCNGRAKSYLARRVADMIKSYDLTLEDITIHVLKGGK